MRSAGGRNGSTDQLHKRQEHGKGLVLSISRYKEIEYEEVRYEKPEVIIEKIEELEGKVLENIEELKWLLNGDT
jgi:hypothetical protein